MYKHLRRTALTSSSSSFRPEGGLFFAYLRIPGVAL